MENACGAHWVLLCCLCTHPNPSYLLPVFSSSREGRDQLLPPTVPQTSPLLPAYDSGPGQNRGEERAGRELENCLWFIKCQSRWGCRPGCPACPGVAHSACLEIPYLGPSWALAWVPPCRPPAPLAFPQELWLSRRFAGEMCSFTSPVPR